MKVGTLMDPNPERRGTRAFTFNPATVQLEAAPDEVVEEQHGAVVNSDEPEPDDPDAA